MQEKIKAGDLVTLKPFAHRKAWEKVGRVQWTRGSFAAIRWIEVGEPMVSDDLSKYPVTQRELSELEGYAEREGQEMASSNTAGEPW